MKRKILSISLIVSGIAFALYILSAFVWNNLNPGAWAIEYRAFIAFIYLIIAGSATAAKLDAQF